MSNSSLNLLQSELVSPDSLIVDRESCEPYEHDETSLRHPPLAVLLAESCEDIQTTVSFCHKHAIPITPRGAGTGLSGGCVPSKNALVISTEQIDDIQIFPEDKLALCGPGVITKDLQDQAALLGLTYPPDPASYEESTLGGNVAENAGGLRCVKYGVTQDYILGLELVTADGLLLTTGILAEREGFNLNELIIGSEGTLGIVTKIALQLIDQPGQGHTLLIAFNQQENAAQTVSDIMTSGLTPTVLEFLDGESVRLANEYEKTDGIDHAEGVLLIETSDINPDLQANQIKTIAQNNQCSFIRTESDQAEADKLWSIRRNMAYAAKAATKIKLSEDIAVPNSHFPAMVSFVAELNKVHPVRMNAFGHAGDGNLHVNLLATENTPETISAIDNAVESILKKAISLGGTLSGEHGIGLTKRQYLSLEFDPATLTFMHDLKRLFDPSNLINPGKLFTLE